MIPIVTPEEMRRIDAAATESVEVLIDRAATAVARIARVMLGGSYGKRVLVIAGKGFNGEDGRVAARKLSGRGVVPLVITPDDPLSANVLARIDLVIDAAYGTGFVDRGTWTPAEVGDVPVLAVDIPSGVNGLTGEAAPGGAVKADRTVTFAALKPGLVLGSGPTLAGPIEVVDIGLDVSVATAHQVEDRDVMEWLPARPPDAHKWQSACWVIAGSPGMTGAAHLAAAACQRAGAGYVRVSSPGVDFDPMLPTETVATRLRSDGWAREAADDTTRFGAAVVGPGLGLAAETLTQVREFVRTAAVPMVVDADGLSALGTSAAEVCRTRVAGTVLTPHDGEFARLAGHRPGPDRIAEARSLAANLGVVVLLKGPATVVAEPGGEVLVATTGDARLATAGTGDVLSGIIGAFLARGLDPWHAAAAAAHVHGLAGVGRPAEGLIARDLVDALPEAFVRLRHRANNRAIREMRE